jgi:hypothetical protein
VKRREIRDRLRLIQETYVQKGLPRMAGAVVVFAALALGIAAAHAQSSTGAPAVSSETIQQTQANQNKQDQSKKGKVILQRSLDANGDAVDSQATQPDSEKKATGTPTAEDAERAALETTAFDMDVRLRPADAHLEVRALMTVRNGGKTPLHHLPLQISSQLEWISIRMGGKDVPFTAAVLNSDADHTGQLHEATVTLATPLAAGSTAQLDVRYAGNIVLSAKRLLAIGTPDEIAEQSDWDRIGTEFTGLRGFGNVVWYPVSSVPVILGDGARLFDEIGNHKRQLTGARFRMVLTVETPSNEIPTVAMVNGQPVALSVAAAQDPTVPSVVTGKVEDSVLGFEAPSLFMAVRAGHAAENTTLWVRPETEPNVAAWAAAAKDVTPFLQGWLGVKPRSQLTIVELPEDGDIPFETGGMLATPVRAAAPEVLDGVMAHALTHAWVMSPRAWLSEGVAHFMGTLWIEKQQGRERALASLDNTRGALAIAEPESPGASDGQPLVRCISPVYYRTKAAYVFWMLRDLVGDTTLSAALRAYDPAADAVPESFEHLLEQAGDRKSLSWFFADWVYADKGLPDLTIDSVFPNAASVAGSYLVAVNLSNNGYAAVEAPVQVITAAGSVTQHVRLEARSKQVARILMQGAPTEVRLNDGTIPETQATVHVKEIELTPAKP